MYVIGKNRLWYSPPSNVGNTVELDILSPDLIRSDRVPMIGLDDVYYADVVFTQAGSHFLRVFEDDVQKHREILVVDSDNLVIYP